MRRRFATYLTALLLFAAIPTLVGCSGPSIPPGSMDGSAPSLDAKSAEERAAAAREAAKKYGTAS